MCYSIISDFWLSIYLFLTQHRWKLSNYLEQTISEIRNIQNDWTLNKYKIIDISLLQINKFESMIDLAVKIIWMSNFTNITLSNVDQMQEYTQNMNPHKKVNWKKINLIKLMNLYLSMSFKENHLFFILYLLTTEINLNQSDLINAILF